jgi:cytoplasmic iron level regulating protein YaaA (DUF328/UPF0246 family)
LTNNYYSAITSIGNTFQIIKIKKEINKMAGINGKSLVQLSKREIQEWIGEDIERIKWYIEVSSKKYPRTVYPRKQVAKTTINKETGEEETKIVSVYDKSQTPQIINGEMKLGNLKAELIKRFPELGYGATEKAEEESHSSAALRLLEEYKAKNGIK